MSLSWVKMLSLWFSSIHRGDSQQNQWQLPGVTARRETRIFPGCTGNGLGGLLALYAYLIRGRELESRAHRRLNHLAGTHPREIEQDEVMGYTAVGKSQKKSKDQKWEKSCAATLDLAGAAGLVSNKLDETGVFNGILIPFSSIKVPETCKAKIWKGTKAASEPAKYLFLKPMQQCAYFIYESPSRFLFRISCTYFMKLFSQTWLLIQKLGLTSLAQPRRYIIR